MAPQRWNKPDEILKPLDDRAVDAINNNFDAIFRLLRDSPLGLGKLPVARGGTGNDTFGAGELLYAVSPTLIDGLPDVITGNVLLSGGANAPPAYGKVNLSGSPIHVTGILEPVHGGTGISSYAVGDLLYASAASVLSKLADVATGNALISGGVATAPAWGKIGLTTHVSGVLPIANGGTNLSSYAQGDILYASAANVLSALPKSTTATRYLSNTGSSNSPAWAQVDLTNGVTGTLPVTSGGTGLSSLAQGDLIYGSASNTFSALAKNTTATRYLANTGTSNNPAWSQVNLANGVTGTLPAGNGGTGLASFAVGDLLYADTTGSLARLADVATGNALISGGTNTAPSWGKIGLTTHVSGTLAVGNGGTGIASFSQGDIIYASGSTTLTALPKSASSTRYLSNTGTTNNPAWAQIDLSNGVTGTLPQANGGTGSTDGGITTSTGSGDFKSLRATGNNVFASGAGVEVVYVSGSGLGVLQAYDRTGAAYKDLIFQGLTFAVQVSGTPATSWDANGVMYSQLGVRFGTEITPSALAAGNNNNYAPTGNATATLWRVTADATGSTLTGITGGAHGRFVIIENLSNTLTIAFENTNSSVGNRFVARAAIVASSITLLANQTAGFMFSATQNRWILLWQSP